MSHRREFEGNNVENAVENACTELNIPREKLKYDVISYGSSGIFGLVGTKKAKIRVLAPEPVETEALEEETAASKPDKPQGTTETEKMEKEAATTGDPEAAQQADAGFQENGMEIGRELLQRIVDGITTDATISQRKDQDRVRYNIDGGNSAILIGKRGQTLEAIQYIIEKAVNKHSQQRIRVQVDVEGYLDMRRDSLKRLAERLADKAKRTGKPVTIGQMNAHERRIVHVALKEDNGIRTKSVGDGFLRKLVIFPKKNVYSGDDRSSPTETS